ncbi:MAG TPA: L-histidine N(alpha)-methyltransferase [Thermoanaerobaculia bacterium]|nr:L-histidine N(alpha)-methyltransferase [Thermoanaerobaculia bacterium]
MTRALEKDRLSIHEVAAGAAGSTFADDVHRGLTASPKTLSPKHLYDAMGSKLFEAICELPEYYLMRAEAEILHAHAGDVAAAFDGRVRLVELGSGDGQKTRLLISALLARQGGLEYLPIDISPSAIEQGPGRLLSGYPGLRVSAFVGEFLPGLQALGRERPREPGTRTLALLLGSTLGNLEPDERLVLLRGIRDLLLPGDGFLLGLDQRKPDEVLLPAYDDGLGVTAAFNLNLLVRINRELGGRFDLRSFRHVARYDRGLGRIEMHLESLRSQSVPIQALGAVIGFEAGETIHTESSYKFELGQVARLAAETGFEVRHTWLDGGQRFGSFLLMAA